MQTYTLALAKTSYRSSEDIATTCKAIQSYALTHDSIPSGKLIQWNNGTAHFVN
jgi:hypothetical protein